VEKKVTGGTISWKPADAGPGGGGPLEIRGDSVYSRKKGRGTGGKARVLSITRSGFKRVQAKKKNQNRQKKKDQANGE